MRSTERERERKKMARDGQREGKLGGGWRRSGRVEEEQTWRAERGREAVSKWIIRKAQLKDNLYFINAAKLHYCSHTQSYCPHSRGRVCRERQETEGGGKVEI